MPNRLTNIKIRFIARHDRLLMQIGATEHDEVRLWLTGRFASRFWSALVQSLENYPEVKAQLATSCGWAQNKVASSMRMAIFAAVLVFSFSFQLTAYAHELEFGDLLIEHPWARASIGPARSGAIYVTLINNGALPDRLLGASTPVAANARIHMHMMQDNIMKMRPVSAIEVAPGEPTVLQPGGLHIMLTGLNAPLVEGALVTLTLEFEKAGAVDVLVIVQEPAAMVPDKAPVHKRGGSS